MPKEDDLFKMKIRWDGLEETIELRVNKKN